MTGAYNAFDPDRSLVERLDIDFTLQAAGLGVWEVDPVTHLIDWDERCRALFGLGKDNHLPYEQAIRYIHTDDMERVRVAVVWAMNPQSGGRYDVTYRTLGADDGRLRWVRFWGKCYFNEHGKAIRMAGVGQDVTETVLEHQQLEESERRFRALIEEASVPTALFTGHDFVIDIANAKAIAVLGQGGSLLGKRLAEAVPERIVMALRRPLSQAFIVGQTLEEKAFPFPLDGENTAYFDFTYSPIRNAHGAVYAILLMAVNVTQQVLARQKLEESEERYRLLSGQLERQVRERTEQLMAANEELAAVNEQLAAANDEYAILNEELEKTNQLFSRSNRNLEQFAYSASHDLQEPLRKVQQFGDLLKTQFSDQLGAGVMYLERMQSAANRMSTLIRDLLNFSRLSTHQDTVTRVSLTNVVTTVLADLDLRIQETGAVIDLDQLPDIQGDRSQLEQLFQNLVSNSLKFRRADVLPYISIRAQLITAAQLSAAIRPTRAALAYYQIDVADNGIGFDEKYLDRIFQVFQRLHGKSEFAGTGIGLAICEKVVANHGGIITAASQPGHGARFSIYLPA